MKRCSIAANGSRLADVIEKELKAKLIQMKNKVQLQILLQRADKILQQQVYAIKHDSDYPLPDDILEISIAKSALQEAELLLNSESDKIGKNDADNIGKPV